MTRITLPWQTKMEERCLAFDAIGCCHDWEGLHTCTKDKGHKDNHLCGSKGCNHTWENKQPE